MAENIGKVVQVIGPTVDCEFDSDRLPTILNAIRLKTRKEYKFDGGSSMHIGDNVVRCVAMASTDGLVRGMKAIDTGQPFRCRSERSPGAGIQSAGRTDRRTGPDSRQHETLSDPPSGSDFRGAGYRDQNV